MKSNHFSCIFLADCKDKGTKTMYRPIDKLQHSFLDFNQPMGLHMNPYLQYFIGLPGFQEEAPFDASTLVLFRKRISAEMLMEANEYLLDHKDDDKDASAPLSGEKTVTMILQKKIQIKEH